MNVNTPIDYTMPPEKDCARYKMHKYWAGKPWYVVAEYIKHFTDEGEIVLDPFCGGGVVGCEALINRRRAVLNDLNPMAVFIAKHTCLSPVDLKSFLMEFEKIRAHSKDEIMDMYRLKEKCPICGGDLYAKHVVRGPALNGKWVVQARCLKGHGRPARIRRFLTPEEKADIEKIEARRIPFWFPDGELPDGREIMRLKRAGITHVHQLFTRRNLLALSIIFHEIQKISDPAVKNLMLLAFSNTLLHVSKLKSESLRPMSANSYYCMGDWIEENVWERFENRVKWRWGVFEGKRETNRLIGDYFKEAGEFSDMGKDGTFMLLNRPAQDLSAIPDESIDYCFTDPPYGGSIQYSELTLLWRSWLGLDDDFVKDEIIVNEFQKKYNRDFEDMLSQAFQEIYRVLKAGRWLTVTFNNRDQEIWRALLNACVRAGFEKVNIVPQKPLGNSFVQSWTGYSLKRDLILNFRKPLKTYTAKSIDLAKNKKAIKSKNDENNSAAIRERAFCTKDIILAAAREYLLKNKRASLSELFEAAVIKWIDGTYELKNVSFASEGVAGPWSRELSSQGRLNMEYVEQCLNENPAFYRLEENNNIFYFLSPK